MNQFRRLKDPVSPADRRLRQHAGVGRARVRLVGRLDVAPNQFDGTRDGENRGARQGARNEVGCRVGAQATEALLRVLTLKVPPQEFSTAVTGVLSQRLLRTLCDQCKEPYSPPPQDPARIGLQPMYRPFFDELKDDGDWTLIEPYGWCFRPRVNFVAWRPYVDGWWEPSDYYGWVWTSTEPFGAITYHYGAWFYDEYQGWVWEPGLIWGPAWVAWAAAGPPCS